MIPILYEKTETAFTSNGICRLPDMISGTVTEERNGIFIAEFEYPVDGENYSEIQMGRIIYCSCSFGKKQPFEIYESSKPINGRVIFYARHLTYRGNFIPIAPFTVSNVSATDALNAFKNHVMSPCTCPFTFESTISTLNTYKQDEPAALRSRLGGVEGSILDVWGGEYEWDYDYTNQRPKIKLWGNRGQETDVVIKYGKNLTDLQQDESIENMITGVVLFFKDEEECVYSDVKYVPNAGGQYTTYQRIGIVDMSGNYETRPTKAQLNTAAESYLVTHAIGVPTVSLNVSFVNLADTEEYKNVAVLERVQLCDTVTVEFEKLGVNATAKVIRTVWDFLNDRYNSVELGNSRTNISSAIIEQENSIKELESEANNSASLVDVQQAIDRATALITGATGGYVVIEQDAVTGYPKEIFIMDTPSTQTAQHVWRWNMSGLGYSSTGINGPYTSAFAVDGQGTGYLNTQFIVANSLSGEKITGNSIDAAKLSVSAQQTIVKNSVTTVQYCLHTSPTTAPPSSATWYDDVPTWTTGKYVWIRYKTVKTLVDDTTDTTYTTAAYDSNTTVALSTATAADATATTANTTANNAIKEEQLIYKTATSGTIVISAPTSWITDTSGAQNTWTKKRPKYDENKVYVVCFVAKQMKNMNDIVTCTTPMIDDTTTVIDGGNIIASSITATKLAADAIQANMITGQLTNSQIAGLDATKLSNQINTGSIGWIKLSDGTFSLANGNFKYTNGSYIELYNNLSLRLNGVPLSGRWYSGIVAHSDIDTSDIVKEVIEYPSYILVHLVFTLKKKTIAANSVLFSNFWVNNVFSQFTVPIINRTSNDFSQSLAYLTRTGYVQSGRYGQIKNTAVIGNSSADRTYEINLIYPVDWSQHVDP